MEATRETHALHEGIYGRDRDYLDYVKGTPEISDAVCDELSQRLRRK